MKIALVQLPWNCKNWAAKGIPSLLEQAGKADLVVFPECMPFRAVVTHEEAVTQLTQISLELPESTFMCGGYVNHNNHRRNRTYLTSKGEVKHWYDKKIRWPHERFEPSVEKHSCFEWGLNKCVPLICADAGDDLTPRKVKMMAEAIDAGARSTVPIVVSSYGGGLMTDYWQPALREWSRGCEAPVVICGVAGWHAKERYAYMGGLHPFGGGGSGAFWPDGYELQTAVEGLVMIDVKEKIMEHRAFI